MTARAEEAPVRHSEWIGRVFQAQLLLAPAFGLAIGLAFAASWLMLDRAFTSRALTASLFVGGAAAVSAGASLLAARRLAARPWSARFAASLIALIVGTAGLASLFMSIKTVTRFDDLSEQPTHAVLLILGAVAASSLYGFLSIAGLLLLPLGVPLTVLFALVIARSRSIG